MVGARLGFLLASLALVATCAAGRKAQTAVVKTAAGDETRELATAATIDGHAILSVNSSSLACDSDAFSTVFCSALATALDIYDTFYCSCAVTTDTIVNMSYMITIDSSSDTDTNTVMTLLANNSANTSSMALGLSYAYSEANMTSMYSSLESVGTPMLTEMTVAATTTTMAMNTSDGQTTTYGNNVTSEMVSTTFGGDGTSEMLSTTFGGDGTSEMLSTTFGGDGTSEMLSTTFGGDGTSEMRSTTTYYAISIPDPATTTEMPTTSGLTTTSGPGYWEVEGMVSFYVEDPVAACADARFTNTFADALSGSFPNYDVTTHCTSHIDARRLQHVPAARRLANDMSFFHVKWYNDDDCSSMNYEMYVSNGRCMEEEEGQFWLYEIIEGELSIKHYSTPDCSGSAVTTWGSAADSCKAVGDFSSWKGSVESVNRYARVEQFPSHDCSGSSTERFEALVPEAQEGKTMTFNTSTRSVHGVQPQPVVVGICYPDEGMSYKATEIVWDGTSYTYQAAEMHYSITKMTAYEAGLVYTAANKFTEENWTAYVDLMQSAGFTQSKWFLAQSLEEPSFVSTLGMEGATTTTEDATTTTEDATTTAEDATTTMEASGEPFTYIRGTITLSVSDGEAACNSEVFTNTVCSFVGDMRVFFDTAAIDCSCAVADTGSVVVSYTFTIQGDAQDAAGFTVNNIGVAGNALPTLTQPLSTALSEAGFSGFSAVTALPVPVVTVEMVALATTTTTTQEPLVSEVIEENVTVVEGSASVEVEDAEATCQDEGFTQAFCDTLGDSVGATPECTCTPESSDRRLSASTRRLAQSVSMSYEITIEADSEISVENVTAKIKTVSEAPETFQASLSVALTKAGSNMTVSVAAVAAPTTKTVTIVMTRTRTSTVTTTVPTTTPEPPQYDEVEVNATAVEGTATMGVPDAAAACANTAFTSTICASLGSLFPVTPECTCAVPVRRLKGGTARRLEESVTITYTIMIEDGSDTDPASIVTDINAVAAASSVLTTQLNTALSEAGVSITVSSTTLSTPTTRATTMTVQRVRTTTMPTEEDLTTSTILNEDETKLTGTIRVTVDGTVTTDSLKTQTQTALLDVLQLDTEVSSAVVQVTIEVSNYVLAYTIITQDDVGEAAKALTAGTDQASTFLAALGQALTTALEVTVTGVSVADFQQFTSPTTTVAGGEDGATNNCLQAAPASMLATALLASATAALGTP